MQRGFWIVFILFCIILLGELIYYIFFIGFPFEKQLAFLLPKPVPGSCLVLEERYCKKGTPVYKDDKFIGMGFSLPAETPIFSPFSGKVSTITTVIPPSSYVGFQIAEDVSGKEIWQFTKAITILPGALPKRQEQDISSGDKLMLLPQTSLSFLEPYNLLLYYSIPTPEKKIKIDKEYTLDQFGKK